MAERFLQEEELKEENFFPINFLICGNQSILFKKLSFIHNLLYVHRGIIIIYIFI